MSIDVYKAWLGIPEEFRPPTHYQLLRLVDFEDDPEKIRAHYKKLNAMVRKYATGDYMLQSQELLNELAKAMLCLTDSGRKREYDESLGREFAEDADGARKPMLRVLAGQDKISKSQIKEIEEFADARGLSHRDAVVQMKLVDEDQAAAALADELGLSYVDLETVYPDDRVLDMLPRKTVRRNSILPLYMEDDYVLIACIDEPDHELEDELRLRFDKPMRAVIATPRQIHQGVAKYYAPGERDEVVAEEEYAQATSGKQKGKAGKGKTAAKKSRSEMSADEKKQQMYLGVILVLWSGIIPAAIDQLVIYSYLMPTRSYVVGLTIFISLITIPPAITFFAIKDTYFK